MRIELPVLNLRPYQAEAWDYLMEHDIKKSFMLWHRRAGKDLFALQYIVAKALERVGNYWYLLPQQNQVRRAIWEGITSSGMKYLDMIPPELVLKRNNSEMKLILRNPKKPSEAGSIISFLGGDNYDALAGSGIAGAVVSELALQKPNLYDLILEPMLKETKGWVMFNTTPRGENHAKDMWDFLEKRPEYYVSKKTIEDTGVVDPADLDEERERGKPEEIIQQEYYVSFAGAIYGAYYADMLDKFKENQGKVPYNDSHLVHTFWDLGVSDSMAIWFVQFIDGNIHVIDYYENHTYSLGHYASVVLGKPYNYIGHHLPHDGVQRQLTPTEKALTIQNQLMQLGLRNVDVIPRTSDVYADIQNVRSILSRCKFDMEHCKDGVMALKQYRREYDENRKCFKNTPLHDWASHACLVAGTKIYTTKGYKNIEDITKDDIVYYGNGEVGYIDNCGFVKYSETLKITLDNGEIIEVTPDHKIFTIRGVVKAENLCYDDIIATRRNKLWKNLLKTKTKSRENVISSTKELNIGFGLNVDFMCRKLAESKQCFIEYFTAMETKKMKFIRLTEILETSQEIIGKYAKGVHTTIKRIENTKSLMTRSSIKKKMDIGGAKHTAQCTDIFGNIIMGAYQKAIKFITKTAIKIITLLLIYVLCLLANILKCMQKIIIGLAAKLIKNSLEKLILNGGRIIEIEKIKQKKPVYDITVRDNHCYYANDILVSNCDAFRGIPFIERKIKGATIQKRSKEWNGRF